MRKALVVAAAVLLVLAAVVLRGYGAKVRTLSKETEIVGISTESLKQYLASTRAQIIEAAGRDVDDVGTLAIPESHMVFPCVLARNSGLVFIFPTEANEDSPTYLLVSEESNGRNIGIGGARPGMEFRQIADALGGGRVVKTWIANEECTAYKLEYKLDGLVFSFVSYEKTGVASELYIYEDWTP